MITPAAALDLTNAAVVSPPGLSLQESKAVTLLRHDAASHDDFRGIPGTFDRAMFALAHARDIGLDTQFQTTVTRRNMGHLPAIAEIVAEMRSKMWSLFFLIVTGRALASEDLLASEYEDVFEYMYQLSKTAPFGIKTTEAMTINETSFFRDSRPFELLRTELLPKLIEARRSTRSLRFWSAACSTGQEAYSLGMLMLEHFPMLAGWNMRIEGTDICGEVVRRARAGCYHRIEMNRGLPARFVVRYFDHEGEDWVVKQEVKKICNFREANLCGPHLP